MVCRKPLPIQRWRMYETLSALQYIAKTCDLSIKTAELVGLVLRAWEGNPEVKVQKEWLETGLVFTTLLKTCLYMDVQLHKVQGQEDEFQCTIDSYRFKLVDD